MRTTDPVVTFLLVLAIGVVVGVLFDRLAGRSWLARQFSAQFAYLCGLRGRRHAKDP